MSIDNFSARRIGKLARNIGARTYLEIGVSAGVTFNAVEIEQRTGVDPNFVFNIAPYENETTHFFSETSDNFFAGLDVNAMFDLFFIDGLHTFEQTLRDFSNAMLHSKPRSIWLIDDTEPSDVFSSLPNQKDAHRFRAASNGDMSWHGDVFKLIFYIHDFCPALDYRTIAGSGNPQTLVWRSKAFPRVPRFDSLERISRLTYFDFRDHIDLMRNTTEDEAIDACTLSLWKIRMENKGGAHG
jgi:hypothetical protein